MNNTTSIVPIQHGTKAIIPKPTQAQMLEVMAHQLIAKRQAENAIRKEKRDKIKAEYDKEAAKLVRKKISLSDLKVNFDVGHRNGEGYIRWHNIEVPEKMRQLAEQFQAETDASTHFESVLDEIKSTMKKEMMTTIMDQPGIKEAIGSAINKLGL